MVLSQRKASYCHSASTFNSNRKLSCQMGSCCVFRFLAYSQNLPLLFFSELYISKRFTSKAKHK